MKQIGRLEICIPGFLKDGALQGTSNPWTIQVWDLAYLQQVAKHISRAQVNTDSETLVPKTRPCDPAALRSKNPRAEKFENFPVCGGTSPLKHQDLLGSNSQISRFPTCELGALLISRVRSLNATPMLGSRYSKTHNLLLHYV